MSATFLAAASSRAADAASAVAAGGDGPLLAQPDFFAREHGAPLLRRNAGCLTPEGLPDEL